MKALTLIEPWATLVAIGAKRIETRSWPTDYRGPIAIHASKKITSSEVELATGDGPIADALTSAGVQIFWQPGRMGHVYQAFSDTRGLVIATARITDCIHFTQENVRKLCAVYGADELDYGDLTVGRYGFVLANVVRLPEPIPARGALGLWDWVPPAELAGAA
jgi:hypothetical protein